MVVGWGPSTGILHGLAVHWLWVGAPVHGMGWLYTGCGLGPQYMVWVGCTLVVGWGPSTWYGLAVHCKGWLYMVVGWGPSTGILHGLAVHWLWVGAPVHGMGWLYTGCGLGPQYMVWVGCTLVVGWGPSTWYGLAVKVGCTWLWVGALVHGMGWLYIVKVGCAGLN